MTAATLVLELIFEADPPPEIHAYCQDPLMIAVKSSLHSTIGSAMMIDDLGSTRGGYAMLEAGTNGGQQSLIRGLTPHGTVWSYL